jgi:hypothetical protein
VMADVLKVKPPKKTETGKEKKTILARVP